jgi:phage-related minor tail protein
VQFAKNGKTLSQGLEELNSKIANSSSETEALNLASEYFGTKGATFMLDAIKRGALDFSDFANAAQNAAGAVGDTFEGTLDPVDKMTTAMNNLKLVGADISETVQGALAPMIEKLVEKLQAFAEWFDNLNPKMKEFIVIAAMIAAAIGPVLVVLGTLISSIGSLVIGISKLGPLVKGLSSAIGVLSKAMAFLAANPIVLVVAAVATLVAVLVHLWKTNEDFRNAIINTWNKVAETVTNVVEAIKKFFTETIPEAAKEMIDWFKELPEKIKQVGIDLITGLWNGIKEKLDWLKNKVTGVVDTIKGWFTGSKGFDVHSPSKWGETLGENVSAGIARGLIDSMAAISQATNRVVSQAQSGLTNMATPQRPVRSVSNGTPALQPVNITLQIDGKILARHLYDPLKTEEMIRGAVFSR